MHQLRQDLLDHLSALPVVDCHAHTRPKREYYADGLWDLFQMTACFDREVASVAGGLPGVIAPRDGGGPGADAAARQCGRVLRPVGVTHGAARD